MNNIEVFDQKRTDENWSFYYKVDDFLNLMSNVCAITCSPEYLKAFKLIYRNSIIEEHYLQEITNKIYEPIKGQKNVYTIFKELNSGLSDNDKLLNVDSFDELVLYQLLCDSIGRENVKTQYPIGNKKYDFLVTHNDRKYLIEFEGIGHFYGEKLKNPLLKKVNFPNDEYTLILWPYWIKKCKTNIEIVLHQNIGQQGIGAIWSSDKHFNEIELERPSEIIMELNSQFNICDLKGIGHFYYSSSRIISQINNPRSTNWTKDRLVPKDINLENDEYRYWLPNQLH